MEKIFTDGFFFKEPAPNAPEFVIGKVSIKVEEFTAFLEKHKSDTGWVNIDLKKSRGGKAYGELNVWKNDKTEKKAEEIEEESLKALNIPF